MSVNISKKGPGATTSRKETPDKHEVLKNQPPEYYVKIMRGGPYDQKLKAYRIAERLGYDHTYVICHDCKRVGRVIYKESPYMKRMKAEKRDLKYEEDHKPDNRRRYYKAIHYVYHYYMGKVKRCSNKQHDKRMEWAASTVLCPKCHKKGVYSTKEEVHTSQSLESRTGYCEVSRVVIRHGRKICYINNGHLELLRNKYEFVKDKSTMRSTTYRDDEGDLLTPKITGFEKMELKIKILEGHKKAKEAGKNINYDVDKKLWECKFMLKKAREANDPKILEHKFLPPDMQKIFDPSAYYGFKGRGKKYKSGKKYKKHK